ncbi:MAG TPA: sigma factor-like helix-turn-helix DNA-binding protein [Candidatus Dormibacteraeota bacterium]|nr:sigma factor-like helix-turn-helix DNA-binding protein [Candidatus Dormibacteraeota bacterium]
MQAEEVAVVAALRAGDRAAAERLLADHGSSMLRAAAAIGGEDAAEALVVRTLEAVLARPESLDAGVPLRVALARALHERAPSLAQPDGGWDTGDGAADLYEPEDDRWAGFWRDMPAPWRRPPRGGAALRAVRAGIVDAVGALPPDLRELLLLRDAEGWTSEDVCLLFGIDPATERAALDSARWSVLRALHPLLERRRAG